MSAVPTIDPIELRNALRLFLEPGSAVEIRVPDARNVTYNGRPDTRTATAFGYFDNLETAVRILERTLSSADFTGAYVTLNPVSLDLMARAENRMRPAGKKDPVTSDKEIRRRRWLLIDCDPDRSAGISSTDEEKAAARVRALEIRRHLRSLGWPDPVLADSGNGYHLLYRIDLPGADPTVQTVLETLRDTFKDPADAPLRVKVDTTVGNAARICKLYGTLARKGDSTAERPHRMARIEDEPDELRPVPEELLRALPAPVPLDPGNQPPPPPPPKTGTFDLDRFMSTYFSDAVAEPWSGGTRWPLPVCPFDESHRGGSAAVCRTDAGKILFKCQHNGCTGRKWNDVRAKYQPRAPRREEEEYEPDSPVVLCVSDVVPERVSWLWYHRAALGKITLIEGDPGLGKSILTDELAACVSTGADLPGGGRYGPHDVVMMSAEDGPADTIRPRLEAASADLTRVHLLTAIRRKGKDAFPSLLKDVALLEEVVREKGAHLVVIDPLMAFLFGADSHKDQDVRQALAPVAAMAERTRASVIVVRHLNKAVGGSAIYRGGGSIGIVGAARAAFLVAKDPDDEERRLIAGIKNNLAPMPPALAFSIKTAKNGSARLHFEQHTVEITADQLLRKAEEAREGKTTARKEAVEWLAGLLRAGPVAATTVKEEAEGAGHSWATIKRAKGTLGVLAEKDRTSKTGSWTWRLLSEGEKADRALGAQGAQGAQESQRQGLEHLELELESSAPNSFKSPGGAPEVLDAQPPPSEILEHLEHLEHLKAESEAGS